VINGIAVQAERLNGGHHLSLTLDDVQGMSKFGLALGMIVAKPYYFF
jgi:hypothetical protein